jgi:hypothetical protein
MLSSCCVRICIRRHNNCSGVQPYTLHQLRLVLAVRAQPDRLHEPVARLVGRERHLILRGAPPRREHRHVRLPGVRIARSPPIAADPPPVEVIEAVRGRTPAPRASPAETARCSAPRSSCSASPASRSPATSRPPTNAPSAASCRAPTPATSPCRCPASTPRPPLLPQPPGPLPELHELPAVRAERRAGHVRLDVEPQPELLLRRQGARASASPCRRSTPPSSRHARRPTPAAASPASTAA